MGSGYAPNLRCLGAGAQRSQSPCLDSGQLPTNPSHDALGPTAQPSNISRMHRRRRPGLPFWITLLDKALPYQRFCVSELPEWRGSCNRTRRDTERKLGRRGAARRPGAGNASVMRRPRKNPPRGYRLPLRRIRIRSGSTTANAFPSSLPCRSTTESTASAFSEGLSP